MREPHLLRLLVAFMLCSAQAQTQTATNFEDADTANEYPSDQHFDLRHTIPGEPGIDYPILSAVPRTSFTCTGKHEGYYADVESRCQAFRICAHTARSAQGFGFLCPNGTLFNQQHFVCDWYRNVNCDESARYYAKNSASRVGSTQDMMETVRQMMEYPMKTISKALQQSSGSAKLPPQPKRPASSSNSSSASSSGSSNGSNRSGASHAPAGKKSAVTRAEIESANQGAHSERGEAVQSEQIAGASDSADDDVYVNSLGELSSDPGVQFDHTNAHIIAEYPREHHYNKQLNFAERVNVGLNDAEQAGQQLADESQGAMAPDYIKQLRTPTDARTQLDLAVNINSLLEDVATDLDASVSGYQLMAPAQKVKQPFRFLSRGFESQGSKQRDKSDAYEYVKPKQTESTVRFTPNDIDTATKNANTYRTQKHNLASSNDNNNDKNNNADDDDDDSDAEEVDKSEATTVLPVEQMQIIVEDLPTTQLPDIATVAESSLALPTEPVPEPEENEPEATTWPSSSLSSTTETETEAAAAAEAQTQAQTQDLATDAPIDPEKVDVNQRAANLLLAGVKLTAHGEHKTTTTTATTSDTQAALLLAYQQLQQQQQQQPEPQHVASATIDSSSSSSTAMSTSTETIIEINSIQERIRGYRRYAQQQRSSTAPTASTAAPAIYARRANVRPLLSRGPLGAGRPATTTRAAALAQPTRSYLQRVAASRLRLSRLSNTAKHAGGNGNGIASNVLDDEPGPDKVLAVRNIDKDTSSLNSLTPASPASSAQPASAGTSSATWESVHNNLQRFQVNRNRGTRPPTSITAATSTPPATQPALRGSQQRGRNRYSNFKTQAGRTRATHSTAAAATAATTATANALATTTIRPATATTATAARATERDGLVVSAQEALARQLSSLTAGLHESAYNAYNTYTTSTSTYTPITSTSTATATTTSTTTTNTTPQATVPEIANTYTHQLNPLNETPLTHIDSLNAKRATAGTAASPGSSSSSSNNNAASAAFLSFDKLTRAIVDDSILQNFKSTHAGHQQPQAATARSSSVYQTKPATAAAAGAAASANAYNFGKQKAAAPKPNIVIARAEGQRLQPNSVSNIVATLATQQHAKATAAGGSSSSNYVSLNDFLHKKFGGDSSSSNQQQQQTQQSQLAFLTQQYQQQQQQPHQHQQQSQPQVKQHVTHYQQHIVHTPQHVAPAQYYTAQQYVAQPQQLQHYRQSPPQQIVYQNNVAAAQQINPFLQHTLRAQQQQHETAQSLQQQPYLTPNIFSNYQQQQQHLPQFPPLAAPGQQQQQFANTPLQQQQQRQQVRRFGDYLNVQLPTLANGLIPQVAQRRSDNAIDPPPEHMSSRFDSRARAFYAGATSYEVPLSSIGRLPNDITQLLRQRLHRH